MGRINQQSPLVVRKIHSAKGKVASWGGSSAPKTSRPRWRRFFWSSPTTSPFSSLSQTRPLKCNGRNRRDIEEEKSHSSADSSSRSGSDSSEPCLTPSRHQRVAKYINLEINTHHSPISLIANDGDLSFRRNFEFRDNGVGGPEDDFFWQDSDNQDCRDDVGLLQASAFSFPSNCATPRAQSEPVEEEEDRVALLSEHDDLFANRRGSYDVDTIDATTLNEPAALQALSLLAMGQDLAAHEEEMIRSLVRQAAVLPPPPPLMVVASSTPEKNITAVPKPMAQETQKKHTASINSFSTPTMKVAQSKKMPPNSHPKHKVTSPTESSGATINPLVQETSAFSDIIRDRTQRSKAFYLTRLKNSKKKVHASPRPAVHGDLFPLAELPSDE